MKRTILFSLLLSNLSIVIFLNSPSASSSESYEQPRRNQARTPIEQRKARVDARRQNLRLRERGRSSFQNSNDAIGQTNEAFATGTRSLGNRNKRSEFSARLPNRTSYNTPISHGRNSLASSKKYDVTSFAQNYAVLLATASKVVYEEAIHRADIPTGWNILARYDKDGHKAVIYEPESSSGHKLAILTFRGTVNNRNWLCNIREIGRNSNRVGTCMIPAVFSVLGIAPSLVASGALVDTKMDVKNLLKWAEKQVNRFKHTHELLVTGHSLGGFLSSVTALQFGVNGIGFSAPSIGTYENKAYIYEKTEKLFEKRKSQGLVYLDFNIAGDMVPKAVNLPHLSTHMHGGEYPITYPLQESDGPFEDIKPLEAHSINRLTRIIQRHFSDNGQ